MKRRLWFLFVKISLCLALMLKPHATAKGAKVFHSTEIQNPTPIVEHAEEPPTPSYREIEANISAYTASDDECGKADGITASGTVATAGRTIAMDGVPFGTLVEIDGHVYVVEDRFGGGYSDRIDIFMDTKEEAFQWGRRYMKVRIYD